MRKIMKKIIVTLMMLVMLMFSGVVNATNGTLLDMEEQFVNMFLDRKDYKTFAMLLSDDIKPDLDEQVYKDFMKDVQSKCGKMKYRKLRVYEKMDDADVLQYEVAFSNAKEMYMYEFAFNIGNSKPMLINFQLITLVQENQQQDNDKKNIVKPKTENVVQQQAVANEPVKNEVKKNDKKQKETVKKVKAEDKKKETKQKDTVKKDKVPKENKKKDKKK